MQKENNYIHPSINWKCLVFTTIIAGGYWFLPRKNKWVLAILLYIPYSQPSWEEGAGYDRRLWILSRLWWHWCIGDHVRGHSTY